MTGDTSRKPVGEERSPRDAKAAFSGARTYITPEGLRRFRDELRQLRTVERPKVVEVVSWAAGNGDRSENGDYIYGKQKLREIDRRIRFLMKRLEHAAVVDPRQQKNRDRVFFGASVTYADADDPNDVGKTVRIVGVDEARMEQGEVSMVSPIARALLKAEKGDLVEIQTPNGTSRIEVIEISYPDA